MQTVHSVHWLRVAVVLLPLALAGCQDSGKPDSGKPESGKPESGKPAGNAAAAKEYPIQGTVTAVDPSKPSVKLDHEEIPDLMPAMEMDYAVENAQVLEGLAVGDQVQGHLRAQAGEYTITHLEKR